MDAVAAHIHCKTHHLSIFVQ